MIRPCKRESERMVIDYLEERFGISKSAFRDFRMYEGSKGRVFLGPKAVLEAPEVMSAGILAARINGTVKPSTNLLQLFGKHAARNAVMLGKEKALAFMRGEDITAPESEATEGYVLLMYRGFPLGCGMLKGGSIKNMVPKAKRLEAEFI